MDLRLPALMEWTRAAPLVAEDADVERASSGLSARTVGMDLHLVRVLDEADRD
jgi:hypothetical protein